MPVSVTDTAEGMASRATPTGAALIPVALFVGAAVSGTIQQPTSVHVTAGAPWTRIDLCMTATLGPILGRVAVEERAAVFQRFTPKTAFPMRTLGFTTISGGLVLAARAGLAAWNRLSSVGVR